MNKKAILATVRQFYMTGGIIYLALLILAIKTMTTASFQLSSNYWTNNTLLGQTSTVFVSASQVLWSVQFRWALVILMGLSIVVPAIYVQQIRQNYKNIDLQIYRFYDWMITGSFMLLIVSVLAGVEDYMALFLILILSIASYFLLRLASENYSSNQKLSILLFKSSVITGTAPWLLILVYLINTWVYGGIRLSWFAYFLVIIGLVNFGFLIYGYFWGNTPANRQNKLILETYPILSNQLIKVLFALVLIIGLKR